MVAQELKRSILITGCSSGIGYSAAHILAARGWQVFATCRKEHDCDRLEKEGLRTFRLDYDEPDTIAFAFSNALSETGGTLDAIFNNGAYAIPGAVEDIPTAAMREIFQANLFGWHELVRLAVPIMRKQGHGRIVQNSSILGLLALQYRGAYVATKFALEGLSDTLRLELHGSGVHVILIEPGPIDTRIRVNSYPHFKKWVNWRNSPHRRNYEKKLIPRLEAETMKTPFELKPEAVVEKLIKAIESKRPRARYYVTTPTYILGLARRLLPARLFDRIAIAITR